MIKLRTCNSFKSAITLARATYGTDDNSCSQIVRRALRSFKREPFEYKKPSDKVTGNPVTINAEFEGDNKDLMGIVITFINREIESTYSRRETPLELDKCDNYIIEQ